VVDYITAATYADMHKAIEIFNLEKEKFSHRLGYFSNYKLSRIDYCINFCLSELGIPCTPEQMMILIKRGHIPTHFEERVEYSKVSHRWKSDKDSFRLESKSLVVNCYNKNSQLLKMYPQ
jgi:hypothetical protein